MAGQKGGLSLPLLLLLLLSLAVPDLVLGINITNVTVGPSPALPISLTPVETSALVPTANSTTPATSSPETSSREVQMDAFTTSTTLQKKDGTSHSTPGSAAGTTVQPDPTPTELGVTTSTTTSIPTTPNRAETTTVRSVGTSLGLAFTSFGIKTSTLPPPTSTLCSTWVGTTLGTSQGPAVTTLLSSTSLGTDSTSSLTDTSDEPSTTPSDTTAALMTSTEAPWSTPATSQLSGTSPGINITNMTVSTSPALPISLTPVETSAPMSSTDFTTAGTIPPSTPATGASTLETSLGTGSASPPTAPASTDTSSDSLITTVDTKATMDTSTGDPGKTSTPSQPVRTMSGITSGISTATVEPTPGTSTVPETPSSATGMVPSSPDTNSTQATDITFSTPAYLPTTQMVCPTTTSNTSASYLFLLLQLTTPLDLENTMVQELLLSKLHEDLQALFPCAGLEVKLREKRKT